MNKAPDARVLARLPKYQCLALSSDPTWNRFLQQTCSCCPLFLRVLLSSSCFLRMSSLLAERLRNAAQVGQEPRRRFPSQSRNTGTRVSGEKRRRHRRPCKAGHPAHSGPRGPTPVKRELRREGFWEWSMELVEARNQGWPSRTPLTWPTRGLQSLPGARRPRRVSSTHMHWAAVTTRA